MLFLLVPILDGIIPELHVILSYNILILFKPSMVAQLGLRKISLLCEMNSNDVKDYYI